MYRTKKKNNAFLIICHKNELQVCNLIKILLRSKNNHCIVFCDLNFSIKNGLKKLNIPNRNIQIIHSNVKIQWGKFAMIYATLLLLEKAIKSKYNFKYFHLISGQDFPIKRIKEINNFFNDNDKIYINFFKLPRNDGHWLPDGGMSRYVHDNINKHELPHNIHALYGGSQWWSITREGILHIFSFLEANPSYITFYSTTFVPDESFFQTILLNSNNLQNKIVNNNLRYIDWVSGPTYPKILVKEDFKKIIKSDDIFARKFEQAESIDLLNLIKIYVEQ